MHRLCLPALAAGAVLLLAACDTQKRTAIPISSTPTATPSPPAALTASPTTAGPPPTPDPILKDCVAAAATSVPTPAPATPSADRRLLVVDPKLLPLPADQIIPGTFQVTDGSIATAQWNRTWDRDPADPGSAAGATRITINARLYLSIEDAVQDFADGAAGAGGRAAAQQAIAVRGFSPAQICTRAVSLDPLGVDQQAAWRVEFTRGNPDQTYVQYFVYLRVRNTRAVVTTFAQNKDGAEATRLLADTKQVAKLQADRLLAFPPTQ